MKKSWFIEPTKDNFLQFLEDEIKKYEELDLTDEPEAYGALMVLKSLKKMVSVKFKEDRQVNSAEEGKELAYRLGKWYGR